MSKNLQSVLGIAMLASASLMVGCGGGTESSPAVTTPPVNTSPPPVAPAPPASATEPTAPSAPTTPTPPVAQGDCQATAVTWAVGNQTCAATVTATAKGASGIATDLIAPNFGSASFSCTDGTLTIKSSATPAPTCMKADIQEAQMTGYLFLNHEDAPVDYDAGYSMYIAAWPLLNKYPGSRVQTGLPGTWMFPQIPDPKPIESYQDIEGGLGWWNDTVFGTETPKFLMGGVSVDFSSVANGPGIGWGDWNKSAWGKYGVAQLSPRLLWPLDGVNMKQGTNGELLGYGYLPLPLTNIKPTTGNQNIPTGNNSWTLFLNAGNFKGPATFFTPYFWSRAATAGLVNKDGSPKDTVGKLFDSRPSEANKQMQMETQYVPAFQSKDSKGDTYARVAPVQFPRDAKGDSVVTNRLMVYKKTALWDSVKAWFDGGGAAVSSQIKSAGSFEQTVTGGGGATWQIFQPNTPDNKRVPIAWNSFASSVAFDKSTLGYSWIQKLVSKTDIGTGSVVTLPQYFRLSKDTSGNPVWAVALASEVPPETGLASIEFKRADRTTPRALSTPMDNADLDGTTNVWKIPGPAKNGGPFQAKLGDGSTVTYYWYLFKNQPTLLKSDLTDDEREDLQKRVEKIHKEWTIDREYLPAPTTGKLADIDPALIIVPPKGFEIGYVPIVTRQETTK